MDLDDLIDDDVGNSPVKAIANNKKITSNVKKADTNDDEWGDTHVVPKK